MVERYFNNNNVDGTSSAKKFRQAVDKGRAIAQEVQLAMFDWFLDKRGCLKGWLPKKCFLQNAKIFMVSGLEQ